MEKINVAELLSNCPSGMELDCTICEDVYFYYVSEFNIIHCYIQYETYRTSITFNQYGAINSDIKSKCVIFPKGKTTWEGFVPPCQFKDGDIVVSSLGNIHILKNRNTSYIYVNFTHNSKGDLCKVLTTCVNAIRLATEEEKAKLFKSIRDNGYKWNPKTKTLQNLFSYNIGRKVWVKSDKEHKYIHTIVGISRNSFGNLEYEVKEEKSGVVVHYPESLLIPVETKFKVGDKIVDIFRKQAGASGSQGVISEITDDKYIFTDGSYIYIRSQDNWELEESVKPEFKVGDIIQDIDAYKVKITEINIGDECYGYESIIAKGIGSIPFNEQGNWKLVSDKFDIDSLVPFESRVLARDNEREKWHPAFWGFYDANSDYPYKLVGCIARYCIPYEGNEHLRGKVGDCDKYFKTWE